jgi:hypothetical protein
MASLILPESVDASATSGYIGPGDELAQQLVTGVVVAQLMYLRIMLSCLLITGVVGAVAKQPLTAGLVG